MAYRPKDTQERILHRAKIARGHLDRVIQMIQEDDYCIDTLHQSQAVQAGLKATDNLILENHLERCVADAIGKGKKDEVIAEIMNVFKKNNMSKRGWIIIGIYVFVLLVTAGVLFGKNLIPKQEIHYHAGFIVYKDNKKLDFSDNKYMNIKPCTTDEETEGANEPDETKEDEQLEKAHLHDNVGDVAHVEAINAKWSDLFTNIQFTIDYYKVTAYINGQKVEDFENKPIKSYDSAVIFIGDVDESRLKEAVTKKHIIDVEKKGDSC